MQTSRGPSSMPTTHMPPSHEKSRSRSCSSTHSSTSHTSAVSGSSRFSAEVPEDQVVGSSAYFSRQITRRDCLNCPYSDVRLVDNGRELEIINSPYRVESKQFSTAEDQKVLRSLAQELRDAGSQQNRIDAAIGAFKDEYPTFLADLKSSRCLLQRKYGQRSNDSTNKNSSRPSLDRTLTGKIPFTMAYGSQYKKKAVNIKDIQGNTLDLYSYIPCPDLKIICADGRICKNIEFFDKQDQRRLQLLAKTQHLVWNSDQERSKAADQFKSRYLVEYNDHGYLKLVKR